MTQVKYIVGTGGALTRLPHRMEIMQEIAKHNETGMMLFPTEHAQILVDNDYIMASLGVLSKRYREAAIKLLEKSLDFKFPEKKEQDFSAAPKYLEDVNREAEEARKRDEEYKQHIEEMESMGYDMSCFKEEEKIGGASEEELKAAKEAALAEADEKAGMRNGKGIKGKWAAHTEGGGQYMGDCTHDCKHCTRRNCPNRVE